VQEAAALEGARRAGPHVAVTEASDAARRDEKTSLATGIRGLMKTFLWWNYYDYSVANRRSVTRPRVLIYA
jgi:hypothetical protein